MRTRQEATWNRWRPLVAEQERSGLSVTAFCRQRQLCISQLYAWKRRLRRTASASLLAVHLAPTPEPEPAEQTHRRPIEVVLPGGLRLLVEAGFDATHLCALLDVLERRA
jgi:transposase-like protein